MALFLLFIIVAIALGIAGAVVKGLFWLLIIGGAIACAVVGVIGLLLIGAAWARWGFLGMFLVLSLILLGIGWMSDRREQKRRSSFE